MTVPGSRVTKANLHGEIKTGGPVGREVG